MSSVDVVIAGASADALAAAIDAVRRGKKVLVVIRSQRAPFARLLRQSLKSQGVRSDHPVTVVTGAAVACVDGVNSVEAVVVRHLRTGRLVGINSSALLNFER